MNKVQLIGNINSASLKKKIFPNGKIYRVFSMATNETWKDKETSERKSKTTWHNCQFNGESSNLMEHIALNGKIYVEGKITTFKLNLNGIETTATQMQIKTIEIIEWKPKTT